MDWKQRTALVFGNEVNGVSEELLSLADATCCVPMTGFVESLNISVAAAIVLHEARESRIRAQGHHATLSAEEQETLRAVYLLRSTVRVGCRGLAVRSACADSAHVLVQREGVRYMHKLLASGALRPAAALPV